MSDTRKLTDSERLRAACANLQTSEESKKARQEAQMVYNRVMTRLRNAAHGVRIVSVGSDDDTVIDDEEAGE